MASTLTSSTLTVRISEEINLNGVTKGTTIKREIDSINEVSERIATVLTTGTDVLSLGSAVGPGAFIRSDVKYIRITNLDDTNYIRLALVTDAGGNPAAHIKVPAKDSFVLATGSAAAEADGDAVSFDNITSIKAWANTASVDIDIFVAST